MTETAKKVFRTSKPCACSHCVGACEHRPGWPTPEEAERIINAGMARRLMYDWWEGDDLLPYTGILCPATGRCGGRKAPTLGFMDVLMSTSWPCTFLKRGKCELHGTNMKPFECRVSMPCKDARKDISAHQAAAMKWNTPKGKAVLLLWQQAIKVRRAA